MYKFIRQFAIIFIFIILTSGQSPYGSSYEINDPGVSTACENANVLSGSCDCPSGYASYYSARVLNDAAPSGGLHGGYIMSCRTSAPSPGFGGTYQVDDAVPGGDGCRFPNVYSGSCSCPGGTEPITFRVLVDKAGGYLGSNLIYCWGNEDNYGGGYQLEDNGNCRTPNPLSSTCSCLPGYLAQPLRAVVDLGTGLVGSYINICVKPIPMVEICSGISADPTGRVPADSAIQTCIDRTTSGGLLQLPLGNFLIQNQVTISKPITVRTIGTQSLPPCSSGIQCSTLLASPSLYASGGMILISNTNNVNIDHIIIDGNRSGRVNSKAWTTCQSGENIYGFNALVNGCTSCSFTNSMSIHSVCGSSLAWSGAGAIITDNAFMFNGDHFSQDLWSDGLTLLQAPSILDQHNNIIKQTQVLSNTFYDNSDVDFICGGASYAIISGNVVKHSSQPSYAGMMLDNFNNDETGNYIGAVLQGNTVECNGCTYGIMLGPHGWYMSSNIFGGNVTGNYISGAYFNLNIDGAGTTQYPIAVYDNTFGVSAPGEKCGYQSTHFVVCPEYTVANPLSPPTATYCLNGCH